MYSIPNQKMDKNQTTFKHDLTTINLVPRVRVALSTWTVPVADQKDRGLWERDWTTISIESVIKQQPLKKKIFRIVLSLSLSVFYHHLYYLINPGVMYKSRINLKDKVKWSSYFLREVNCNLAYVSYRL